MKPYHILYLHHTGRFAGAENSLLHLATHLAKSLFAPIFICPGEGEFPRRLRERGIAVIPHEFGANRQLILLLKSLFFLLTVIRREGIALLHANGPQTNIPAGIAGRMMGVPVVWHARNCLREGMVDIDRLTGFLPQRIICNSEAVRGRFIGSALGEKGLTILNSISLSNYDPGLSGRIVKDAWKIPAKARVVGMIGRLGYEKGHQTLLEAMKILSDGFPDLWVLMVGGHVFDDDQWIPARLREAAANLGLSDRVVFTGHQDNVVPFYAALDIFVLATDREACGRVLFEAMAMGKPVIGTDNGGTPEIVVDGETGLLFPYGDARALADKIGWLLERPYEMTRMGQAGRRRIEAHFTIEQYMEKTQRVYLELLEGKDALGG